MPPRLRIERRVATTPPGSTSRVLGAEGEEDTSPSYEVHSERKRNPKQAGSPNRWGPSVVSACVAALLWCSTVIGEHLSVFAPMRWLSILILLICLARNIWHRSWKITPLLLVAVVLTGIAGGAWAWNSPRAPLEGECTGEAVVRSDPTWIAYGTGVILEMRNVRYKAIVHGVAGRRLSTRLSGEHVFVTAMCSANEGRFARVDAVKHVVGRMNVRSVSEEFSEGSPVTRAANRMRRAISDGVAGMNDDLAALFRGLVMGDDRDQPRAMLNDFRTSGLSHLCAVSGQNVAYLLAAMSPLLQRMGRWWRWFLIMGLLGWFVLLTRGEPSVLRAAFMASMVATNSLLSLSLNARTVVAGTVVALLMIDPMLAWSVGFALSVGATVGLAWMSASLSRIVGGRGVVAATLAAQAGTFPISLAVFGYIPVISLVANPLVISVAGAVMMCGLPLALVATTFPALAPMICAALTVPVWWVNTVAHVSAQVSPHGVTHWALWAIVLLVLGKKARRNGVSHTVVAR